VRLALALALLLSAGAAHAQFLGGGSIGGGGAGATFTGGTLSTPLVLDATETLCSAALSLAFEGDTNMGLQRAAADTLSVCLNAALALQLTTSAATFSVGIITSGVTTDITTATGEDLIISGGGTSGAAGSTILSGRDEHVEMATASGTVGIRLIPTAGGTQSFLGVGGIARLGTTESRGATSKAAEITDGTSTMLWGVYGSGLVTEPSATLTITGAELPTATSLRISSASSLSWTPTETNAVDGWLVRACNVNASDTITMADVDGQYEGPGTVLGPQDCVTFQYQSDRWRQLGASDNEP
jgi:hypothetical protein